MRITHPFDLIPDPSISRRGYLFGTWPNGVRQLVRYLTVGSPYQAALPRQPIYPTRPRVRDGVMRDGHTLSNHAWERQRNATTRSTAVAQFQSIGTEDDTKFTSSKMSKGAGLPLNVPSRQRPGARFRSYGRSHPSTLRYNLHLCE